MRRYYILLLNAFVISNTRAQQRGAQQDKVVSLGCEGCLSQGGRQCLLRQEWTYGVCCDPRPEY